MYQHGTVQKSKPVSFNTPATSFKTTKKTKVVFTLPEFSETRQITGDFHVLPEDSKLPYDFIIRRDLMRALKINVLYSEGVINWDNLRLPMQEVKSKLIDFNAIIEDASESEAVKQQTTRLTKILDAKYEKPNLEMEVAK